MGLPSRLPSRQHDRRRSPADMHHDDRFRDITELPWEPPACAPMSHADIAIEFSSYAPDMARSALRTVATTSAAGEVDRAAAAKLGGD